jgi:hypothetical protein
MINVNRMLRGIDWKAYGPYSDQQSQARAFNRGKYEDYSSSQLFQQSTRCKKREFYYFNSL